MGAPPNSHVPNQSQWKAYQKGPGLFSRPSCIAEEAAPAMSLCIAFCACNQTKRSKCPKFMSKIKKLKNSCTAVSTKYETFILQHQNSELPELQAMEAWKSCKLSKMPQPTTNCCDNYHLQIPAAGSILLNEFSSIAADLLLAFSQKALDSCYCLHCPDQPEASKVGCIRGTCGTLTQIGCAVAETQVRKLGRGTVVGAWTPLHWHGMSRAP